MTSTTQKNGRAINKGAKSRSASLQRPGKLSSPPGGRSIRRVPSVTSSVGATGITKMPAKRILAPRLTKVSDAQPRATAIEQCVQGELHRYFDMLDGEEPANLFRMVMKQAENAVINMVMEECRGNQTRASEWLGISRGNLRTKLANMDK